MPFRTIPIFAGAWTALLLAGPPAGAQSLFEQMPTAPEEAPQAAPASPGPATGPSVGSPVPSMGAAPAPAMAAATVDTPPAQKVAPTGADCNGIQKTLLERKNLVARANAASNASKTKQKMTPQQACALFNQLQANGVSAVKWITANKEWCSIPDSFSDGFKADHGRVGEIRNKVCGIAAQASKMEAQAREQGGGLLGGPGLTGSFKMPQGAL